MSNNSNRKNRYVYNPIINKKFEGQSAVEAIMNINKKSIKEEIGELDDNLIVLKDNLEKMKKNTLRDIILSGHKVPNSWKTKLNFRDMVKNLIEKDEKTTKYILDNKLLDAKEKDMNMNLRSIILNSPVLSQLKNIHHLNSLKKLINENSVRVNSTDSSEEEFYMSNRKEKNEINGSEIVFSPTINNTDKNKTDNELKFTFSPMKSLVISNIETFNKTKNKNNNIIDSKKNIIEVLTIQNSDELNLVKQNSNDSLVPNIFKLAKKNNMRIENKNNLNYEEELNINNNTNQDTNNYERNLNRKENKFIKMETFSKINTLANNENNRERENNPENSQNKINLKIQKNMLLNFGNVLTKKSVDDLNENTFNNPNNLTNTKSFRNDNPVKITLNKNYDSNSKEIKNIDDFRKMRAKRINHSVVNSHSIIDYSMNKSDYIGSHEKKRSNFSALNLIDKQEKERNNLINEKIKVGNEKLKELISKTKKKGHYGPYFSLCRDCNDRNNQFYEKINEKNAIKILKIIDKN